MHTDFLLDKFKKISDRDAIIWRDKIYSYGDILNYISDDMKILSEKIKSPKVVALEADFSPRALSLMLCLIELNCIVVPLTESVRHKKEEFKKIAEVEVSIVVREDNFFVELENVTASHEMLMKLKNESHPGLIIFSSGSTGESKAAVHDFLPLLNKFKIDRRPSRWIIFLLFDHIGGINSLFHIISSLGCVVTVEKRTPDAVCRAVEKYRAEVLPTSPSFLNMLIFSEAYKNYDLSSLKMITYGTEPMPENTLLTLHKLFPEVKIQQKT